MNSKTHASWNVLRHGPIEELEDGLWRVEGDIDGMSLKRVMTVAARQTGGLVVHNAIALDEAGMKRLDAWGPVEAIVVPNGYHRLDAGAFKARYPSARVYCPLGARERVAKAVAVDGIYGDFPEDPRVSFITLDGVAEREGVMVVRSPAGTTLVFNDAIFNLPHQPGFSGFVFRHVTYSTGGPRVTRIMRWFVVKEPVALKAHLERLANTPDLKRVIVSHGRMVEGDAAAMVREAAASMG